MIFSPAIAEKVGILTETSDDLLQLFPPLERAVIVALKTMKNKEAAKIP
jgi:hypothetical protein